MAGSGIAKLDFVEITISITHERTGDLDIVLQKEGGAADFLHHVHQCQRDTVSHLEVCSPIDGYTFSSVRHLDESADGRWTLTVMDKAPGHTGTLDSWKLDFHGRP